MRDRLRSRSLPVMRPQLPGAGALLPYLERIDEARVYSNWGPLTEELKQRLSAYFCVGTDQVTVLANGTLALQAAVQTAGQQGDTWSLPSWTFVASAFAVASANRRLHFVDVDPDTWAVPNPGVGRFAGHLVVAPFGDRPEVESWSENRAPTVIDAASGFDACRGIGPLLGPATALMVSLHATKPLAAGEGGVLVGPVDWIREVERWANFGFYGDRSARSAGSNAKMSEYHAAVALASLDVWDKDRARWHDVIAQVVGLSGSVGVKTQPALMRDWVTSTWICELPTAEMKLRLERECTARSIEFRDWWGDGVACMPYFRSTPRDDLLVTEDLAARTVGLPLFRDMQEGDLHRVASVIEAVVRGGEAPPTAREESLLP